MNKLFLSSSFKDVAELFVAFAEGELTGKTVTFIPTAALPEKVKFYVESGRKALEKMGLLIDELEITTASTAEIEQKLCDNEFIYITGGNTFFLLQELKRTGADKLIVEQIKSGKCYIGESAGSIILSPNIEYIKDMDNHEVASALTNFDSLNIIDHYPVPHQNCFPFAKTVAKIIANYGSTLPLMPISNTQVICVQGDQIEIQNKVSIPPAVN